MSTSWYKGGDLSPKNQVRNPLKSRYVTRYEDYVSAAGNPEAPVITKGTAQVNTTRQVRESYGHPHRLLGKSGHDIGGRFTSLRTDVTGGKHFGLSRLYPGNPGGISAFSGFLFASSEAANLAGAPRRATPQLEMSYLASVVPQVSTSQMYSQGTTAINRCAPTNPLVDLSTSMAELIREGLPSIPGRSFENRDGEWENFTPDTFGGEYLNYQFGIAPLISDVRDMRKVLAQAEALWSQYEENSGEHIRRHFSFPESIDRSVQELSNQVPKFVSVTRSDGSQQAIGPSGSVIQPGTMSRIVTTTTKVWFDGAFTYYLPKSKWGRKMAELDKLYGLRPGVDTLYQLTPWSWLADYFANMGDVIENLNAFSVDGLVMPYGYVMAQKTMRIDSRLTFRVWSGDNWSTDTVSDVVEYVSKRRLPATPFGFGLTDSSLSKKQWSILAALGLTRM